MSYLAIWSTTLNEMSINPNSMSGRMVEDGPKQKPQIGQMGHKQATWIFKNSAVRISDLVTYNASYLPFQRPGDLLLWSTSMFQYL